jgi:hypothetical protein
MTIDLRCAHSATSTCRPGIHISPKQGRGTKPYTQKLNRPYPKIPIAILKSFFFKDTRERERERERERKRGRDREREMLIFPLYLE